MMTGDNGSSFTLTEKLVLATIFLLIIFGVKECSSYLKHDDNKELEAQRKLAVAWTKWANDNCEPVVQMYGGEAKIGKFTYVFSGTMVSCSDKQTYIVGRRVQECLERLGACRGIADYVPPVPTSVNTVNDME